MRFRLSLLGGQLLDFEISTDKPEPDTDPRPFGFTGRCDGLELTSDRNPLTEKADD